MSKSDLITAQKTERAKLLKTILESTASRKIIVAGAGTGKTFTFSEVLKLNPEGVNLAMTFIRLLRNDMEDSFGSYAEVRTFHEFCKKILHERKGGILLYPKLTEIIAEDASHLEVDCQNFDKKFQSLDTSGNEITFYLKRGDYYNTVSFNDSVYRMLLEIQKDHSILDAFDQILIDEFQDFNRLEVAFIDELEKRGNILIVGDDDQAVYDTRFSTPHHLREKFNSGNYERFELPFCSRCTEVIVKTTNNLLKIFEEAGGLEGRIQKRYECFIELKDHENQKYPKITTAHLTNVNTVISFIRKGISKISVEEVEESWQDGKEYPTILIVGARQYLNGIYKNLKDDFQNITFKQRENNDVNICDGYDFLCANINSNLGWRIIINFYFSAAEIKSFLIACTSGNPLIILLPKDFVELQTNIVAIVSKFNKLGEDNTLLSKKLETLVPPHILSEIMSRFLKPTETGAGQNKTQPSILLTSYQGCKGMSAGFVYIIGVNNGVMPKDINTISDVEICQFVVALTRTRKKCYILSENWMYSPKDPNGKWIPKHERSIFINMIPADFLEDLGDLNAKDIQSL
jgi:superfamily I DNA/RNA helicase